MHIVSPGREIAITARSFYLEATSQERYVYMEKIRFYRKMLYLDLWPRQSDATCVEV